MLISRDRNSQSDSNFFKSKETLNNNLLHDHESRKPILKKHVQKQNELNRQVQNFRKSIRDFNKQNHHYGVSIVVDRNNSQSQQNIIRKQGKKKSTFLQSLDSSQRSKSRNRSRKVTYLSTGSDKMSGKNYQSNYGQSKIDIIFSNSNISDDIWDSMNDNVIEQVSQKRYSTKHKLQCSDVVEVEVDEFNDDYGVPKINLKMVDKYRMQNSDRIMENSDEKDSKTSKIFTDKQTVSTNYPSQYQSTTCPDNFRQTSYYEGFQEQQTERQQAFFTIIRSPPNQKQDLKNLKTKCSQSIIENEDQNESYMLRGSKSQLTLSNGGRTSIYRQKIQQSRQRLKQALGESIYKCPQQLGFSVNYTDSSVISKSSYMARVDKFVEFREQMFQKINLYRFLNRLEYKIVNYLSFESNQQILEVLIDQIIRKKCYILLNAQIELESLTKSQKKFDERDQSIFLQIIQAYIEKQSQCQYWKEIKKQFEKVSFLCFSLKDTALQFLQATIPSVQHSLQSIKGKLDRGVIDYETLLFQLRIKIMKYLYYDMYKLNLGQHSHQSNIRDTPFNKQRKLKKIIEENQWFEKIPFKELLQQFNFLKQDVQHICHQNV